MLSCGFELFTRSFSKRVPAAILATEKRLRIQPEVGPNARRSRVSYHLTHRLLNLRDGSPLWSSSQYFHDRIAHFSGSAPSAGILSLRVFGHASECKTSGRLRQARLCWC